MPRGRGRGRGGAARRRGRGRGRGRGRIGNEAQRRQAAARFRQPHTGKQAGRIASNQAGLEFNPVIRQMRGEARASARREGDLGAWYSQLASDYATGAQQAQAAYQASEAETSKRIDEAGDRGTNALKELSKEDSKLASLVGGPRDSRGTATRAAAQAAADRQRTELAQPNTEAGANAVAYAARRSAGARLRGIEAQRTERRGRNKTKQDLATARREKGRAIVANMETLRAGDRDFAIQQRAFPLERQKLTQDARQDAIDNRFARRKERRAARQDAIGNRQAQERIGVSRRNARTTERNSRGGKDGLTPSQRRAVREDRRSATAAAWRTIKANGVPKSPREWAGLEAIVAKEEGLNAAQARAAVKRIKKRLRERRGQGNRGIPGTTKVPYAPPGKQRRGR